LVEDLVAGRTTICSIIGKKAPSGGGEEKHNHNGHLPKETRAQVFSTESRTMPKESIPEKLVIVEVRKRAGGGKEPKWNLKCS